MMPRKSQYAARPVTFERMHYTYDAEGQAEAPVLVTLRGPLHQVVPLVQIMHCTLSSFGELLSFKDVCQAWYDRHVSRRTNAYATYRHVWNILDYY